MGTDSTLLHRFLIAQLVEAGLDRDRLLHGCGLPDWALTGPAVHVPSDHFGRLWEIAEQWLDDPDVALRVASRYELPTTGLYDYLFSSALTVATSPRTLQRRLTESGTTWRRELDRARLRRAAAAGPVSRARQAQLLGYADAASMRRAAQRWTVAAQARSVVEVGTATEP